MTETECIFPHDFFVASASLPFPPAEFAHYQQFLWRDCHLYDPHATGALAPSNVLSASLYNNSTVLQQQQRPVLDDLFPLQFIQTQDFGAAPAAPQQYLQQQLYQQLQLQQLLVQAPTQQRSPSPNQWNVPSPDSDCSEDSPCIPLIEQDESSFFLYDTLKAEPAVPQVFSPDSMESRSTSASASPQKRRYRKRRHAETESASSGEEGSPSPNLDGVQLKRTKGCQKVVWTAALQATFLEAIEELGIGAMPIQLKTRMNVPGLTVRNIASHLHKYRLRLDANAKNAGAGQTTVRSASPVDALAAASSPSRPISPTPPLSPNSSGSPNTPSTTEQK